MLFFGKRKKYSFNHDTLTFEQVNASVKDRLVVVLLYTLFGSIAGLIAIILAFSYVKTPAHQNLIKENIELKNQFVAIEKRLDDYLEVMSYLEKRDSSIYRELFGAAPLSANKNKTSSQYREALKLDPSGLVSMVLKKIDDFQSKLYQQSISYDTLHNLVRNQDNYLAHVPAIQPISNKGLSRIASGFGLRFHPILNILKLHTGLDFAAPTGTPIYATGDGQVLKIEDRQNGYGKHVVIDHSYGYQTLYAHMSKFEVKGKQKVKRGDIIGYVGNTGTSTSAHLHYEVIRNGKHENPVKFFFNELTPEEYEEILKISQNAARSFD